MITNTSILQSSGLPCRDILDEHAKVSLISKFIIGISHNTQNSTHYVCIRVTDILRKRTMVETSLSGGYIIKLSNNQ